MAEVQADPRLARLVAIEGTSHRGRLVVGAQTGGAGSALNQMVRDLAKVASRFRVTASEVRVAGNMLDSERGQRIGEATAPLVKALKDAAKVYAEQNARIQHAAQTATAVAPYGPTTAFHEVTHDSALVSRFNSMQPTERVVLLHRCTHETSENLRWASALLRVPPELSDLTPEQHDGLRLGVLKAIDPAGHAAISNELEQAEQARRALQLAQQVLREDSPSTAAEVRIASVELAQALGEA